MGLVRRPGIGVRLGEKVPPRSGSSCHEEGLGSGKPDGASERGPAWVDEEAEYGGAGTSPGMEGVEKRFESGVSWANLTPIPSPPAERGAEG